MTAAPKTPAAAIALLETLQEKRAGLVGIIDSSADRCRGLAVAAHLGDGDAAEELREIEAEEATARNSMRNLAVVIAEIERTRDALLARETVIRESRNSAELAGAIDELLELDDALDDALDHARDLLAQREAFKREKAQVLRRQPGKMFGAMIGRENEVSMSLAAYFDKYLGGGAYASITRLAEFDSRYYGGRPSARMLERGPREPSRFERTFRKAFSPRSPIEVAPSRQVARR
jgi:chromosome segregation ATPase